MTSSCLFVEVTVWHDNKLTGCWVHTRISCKLYYCLLNVVFSNASIGGLIYLVASFIAIHCKPTSAGTKTSRFIEEIIFSCFHDCSHLVTHSCDGTIKFRWGNHMDLYSLSGKTSYRQISRSLEAARLGVIVIVSLWNLTDSSAALLPECLSNFRAIVKV